MDADEIAQVRQSLPAQIFADWAASALPSPTPSQPPVFLPPAHSASAHIHTARAALRQFLGDNNHAYHIIFTSGATAALALFARLPWTSDDTFFAHAHLHNAALGIRQPAVHRGATFAPLTTAALHAALESPSPSRSAGFALLAYPAECNLSGAKYPLQWSARAKTHGIAAYPASRVLVLVDAAKFAASSPLVLDQFPHIDALVVSMYKLCAMQTGLGALLVRRASLLESLFMSTAHEYPFAGGSSVQFVTPFSNTPFVPASSLVDMLEIGSPHLRALHALPAVLQFFAPRMHAISTAASDIAARFRAQLLEAFGASGVLIHRDPSPLVDQYGAVVSFSLMRWNELTAMREFVPYSEIGFVLAANGVHVRTGCMCNVGACASVLQLSEQDLHDHFSLGHRCGDGMDVINGKPSGVTRVSFGWASLPDDATAIVRVLKTHVSMHVAKRSTDIGLRAGDGRFSVSGLYLYPVKACGGFEVSELVVDSFGGALGDRAFGIEEVGTGKLLDVRSCRALTFLSARYSNCRMTLELYSSKVMDETQWSSQLNVDIAHMNMFKDGGNCEWRKPEHSCEKRNGTSAKRQVLDADGVSEWISAMVGRRANLVQLYSEKDTGTIRRNVLLVSKSEVKTLAEDSKINKEDVIRASIRPNIVVEDSANSLRNGCLQPLIEHGSLTNAAIRIDVVENCTRCSVVNIIANSMGMYAKGEPLRSIARMCRECNRKGLVFGVLAVMGSERGGSHASKLAGNASILRMGDGLVAQRQV